MAKRSQMRLGRQEKNRLGCMWGLINMFDFRHGRTTQRLLLDRRRGNRHSASNGSPSKKPEALTSGENGPGIPDERKTTVADTFKPHVKKLIGEVTSMEQIEDNENINAEEESRQQESEHLDQKQKNRRRKSKSHAKCFDILHDLDTAKAFGSVRSCYQSEQQTLNNLDMDNLMEEFCHQIYQKSVDCLKHDQANHNIAEFTEKLTDVVKFLVSQKLVNGDFIAQNGELQTSKELMEALRILSSDEELILKLLRDPNSLVVRYAPDLPNSRLKKDEQSQPLPGSNLSEHKLVSSTKPDELVCHKQRNFFRRKAKSNENNDLRASNKIVILKPGIMALQSPETGSSLGLSRKPRNISRSKEANEKVGSQFFLAEIKRKFKHAMGKEQHRTSSDGVSTIPVDHQTVGDGGLVKGHVGMNSPTKDHFFIERIARPSVSYRRGEKMGRMKEGDETADLSKQKGTDIYVEARKHLSNMLGNGHENVDFTSRQVRKTLGSILSLPEFSSSPASSPRSTKDATAIMKFTASDEEEKMSENNKSECESHPSQAAENSENGPCSSDDKTTDEVQDDNLNLRTSDEGVKDDYENGTFCQVRNDTTPEGTGWISEATKIVIREESTSIDGDDTDVNISEAADKRPHHQSLKQCEEDQLPVSPPASPPSPLVTKKVEFPETYPDIHERPSPVSVLEPPFAEDVISPASARFRTSEKSIQPQKIPFEESDFEDAKEGIQKKAFMDDKEIVFEYVKLVLEASSLSWDELLVKSLPSEQLLCPSLLDEIELPSNQLCLDQELLFDCVNEVLMGLQEHYFGSSPWVSFVKPDVRPIPNMENFREEVWQGVYWHLLPMPLPCTLDQTVRKDMAKSGTWLDLRLDTDCIGIEMVEAILEDLMEDTILSYADANQEDGSCILDELKKNASSTHIDDRLRSDYSISTTEVKENQGITN